MSAILDRLDRYFSQASRSCRFLNRQLGANPNEPGWPVRMLNSAVALGLPRARTLRLVIRSHVAATLMACLFGFRLLRSTVLKIAAVLLVLTMLIALVAVIGLLLLLLAFAREVTLLRFLSILRMIMALLVVHVARLPC